MILCHELGEIDVGDITPSQKIPYESRVVSESAGVKRIADDSNFPNIYSDFKEYLEQKLPEAIFTRQIDKLDSILQAREYSNKYNRPEIFAELLNSNRKYFEDYLKYFDMQ